MLVKDSIVQTCEIATTGLGASDRAAWGDSRNGSDGVETGRGQRMERKPRRPARGASGPAGPVSVPSALLRAPIQSVSA